MFKPAMLALAMMLAAPVMVQAAEITLIPAVKLQIGDQDNRGYYWDGGNWRDHSWWNNHYEWRDNRWHAHTPPPPPHHDNGHHNGHHNDHHDNHGHGNDHRPPSNHH
ncbi:DUF2502 domain-containing protein [Kluyvera sp. NPDC087067]|uniref:DUF2502 domain-containing protein n=1 Tax=Kluyvera sp. NPDC087067 TaxID=3364105 RepID=UPI0037F68F7C